MSLCTVCGSLYCEHTPKQRGQSLADMMAELTPYEKTAWKEGSPVDKIKAARRSQRARENKRNAYWSMRFWPFREKRRRKGL